jgi:Transposase DDE domain
LTAVASGRERVKFSDADASWGHRSAFSTRKGGGFFGDKAHLMSCARTDLPIVRWVETAKTHESKVAPRLLEAARSRGFTIETVTMDKGYDQPFIYEACEAIRRIARDPDSRDEGGAGGRG